MKTILNILSSPMGPASYSTQLSKAIIENLLSRYPGSTVHTYDLTLNPFPHIETAQVASFFTPPDARTEDHLIAFSTQTKLLLN